MAGVASETSWGGCGHGHAMAGGERFSGKVVGLAREGGGARGEGESGRGLTAVLLVLLARQGRHGVRRIDGGDHRHPRSETAALEMQQSFWRRVTRWRGRRRRGGASGRVGEARGRRWPRWWRSAATGSLGWLWRERWGGEGGTRGGEMQGVSWRSWRPPAAAAASRRWPRACWRAEATRPCLLA